jgi:hypothetical protein
MVRISTPKSQDKYGEEESCMLLWHMKGVSLIFLVFSSTVHVYSFPHVQEFLEWLVPFPIAILTNLVILYDLWEIYFSSTFHLKECCSQCRSVSTWNRSCSFLSHGPPVFQVQRSTKGVVFIYVDWLIDGQVWTQGLILTWVDTLSLQPCSQSSLLLFFR